MRLITLFFALSLYAACSPVQEVETKDENGLIIERYQIEKKSGLKNGIYQRLDHEIVIEQSNFYRDTLHGLRTIFNRDGQKEIEEHYEMGVYHGPYLTFYSDGSIKLEGLYSQGTMEGTWQKYYPNGQLMEKVTMHNNQEEGPFIEYWENGNLKAEGDYLDGDNEHGTLKLYDEQGVLEKIMQCDRGVCHTTWKQEMQEGQ